MDTLKVKYALAHILFVVSLFLSHLSFANDANVTVTVKDHVTKSTLPNLKIYVFSIQDDGTLQWFDTKTSDANGIALLSLPEIENGQSYRLASKVYNDRKSYSLNDITQPGDFPFEIGNVTVNLTDGTQEGDKAIANAAVTFYQLQSDGSKKWFDIAKSDANGRVKVNLPDLDSGTQYQLAAKSPITGETKYGNIVNSSGHYQFSVGNKPVHLTFKDDFSKQPLIDLAVTAYKLNQDNSKTWVKRFKTDLNGQVSFDLDEINTSEYIFKLVAFNNFNYSTNPIKQPGSYQFNLGTFRVTLKDGSKSNKPILANTKATLYEVDQENKKHYFSHAVSDENGVIKIDINGFSQGKRYQLKSSSPVDGSNQYSEIFTQSGDYQFIVGNPALNVLVKDGYADTPIQEQKVYVYQAQNDGTFAWFKTSTTDSEGKLTLDLPGLGNGTHYKLKTKAFNNFTSYSNLITSLDDVTFYVGTIKLSLISGADGSAMSNKRVDVYKLSEQKLKWANKVVTDDMGIARFDLEFSNDETYQLKAASPSSGASKYSELLSSQGDFTFTVGNPAVVVSLTNYLTHAHYANQMVHALKVNSDNTLTWHSKSRTDEQGIARFDLEGLQSGAQYIFKTSIFNGVSSYSDVINNFGDVSFQVGKLPVTLEDKETLSLLPNIKLTLYALSETGSINWHSSAKTDANGSVTFDPEKITQGQRYVIRASDPFGEGASYYGPIVNNPGHVLFSLKKGESRKLDLIPPQLAIAKPIGESVPTSGFWISGTASDNQAINRLTLSLADPQKGTHEIALEAKEGNWKAFIPANYLTLNNQLTVTATAYDYALNTSSQTLSLNVLDDNQAPIISFVSPSESDSVNSRGFSVLGHVNDEYDVASVSLSLHDSQLGNSINNVNLEANIDNGQWAYFVNDNAIAADSLLTLTVEATDYSGNKASQQLQLSATELSPKLDVLVRRTTFGVTPELHQSLALNNDFLTQQLSPETIDDSEFEAQMAAMPVTKLRELKEFYLAYMLGSKKQLREVMTWFWENHFNTFYHSHGRVSYELNENLAFRENALGNFHDLLMISAKSPAMLRYLNNAQNIKSAPNENYAREIMELHTLGIDGGYTNNDVAELSRIFTGWHIRDNAFYFRENQHDFGEKVFLSESYFGDGLSDGEKAIMALANHPATAQHLCQKLARFFITESPSEKLVSACKAQYLATSGNIKSVLEVIFNSSDLDNQNLVLAKLKTPVELITATARNTNAEVNLRQSIRTLNAMGMPLFENPVPTGYSEMSEDWLNANAVMLRLQFVNRSAWRGDNGVQHDIANLLISQGLTQTDAILTYLFELLLANQFTQLEYDSAKSVLTETGAFDIYSENANQQLARLLATMMSYPNYQLQ